MGVSDSGHRKVTILTGVDIICMKNEIDSQHLQ